MTALRYEVLGVVQTQEKMPIIFAKICHLHLLHTFGNYDNRNEARDDCRILGQFKVAF
jgi:hypothetical protein